MAPEVTQAQYDFLQKVEERKEKKALLRQAEQNILKKYNDEVKRELARLSEWM